MKNLIGQRIKYILLAALFVVTLVITYIRTDYSKAMMVYSKIDAATFPIVMMQTDSGIKYNLLHGYDSPMDLQLMNEYVTPLPADKKLKISIDTYGENIKALKYVVRETKTKELIEETEVKDYSVENDTCRALLNIKNLIENNENYMLEIILATDKNDDIHYYTKIIAGVSSGVDDKLNFVRDFNSYTYDKEALKNIQKWIESKASGPNSNFGKVNINSSMYTIGWGELSPKVESDIIPGIHEISNEFATISIDYKVAIQQERDFVECMVTENYRVRQTTRGMYLLNYERTANQIFDGRNALLSSNRINLGIRENDDIKFAYDKDGKFLYYVIDGNLWCLSAENRVFTRVFSFGNDDVDGIRENFNNHDVKILKVNDDGEVTFVVYGYMNRGGHEGEVGIALFTYNRESNDTEEKVFIPVNASFDVLKENVGKLCYVNEYNTFYVLIDDTLYSIDLTSMEWRAEIENLVEGSYATAQDGSIIAYCINSENGASLKIDVFNIEKDSKYELKATDGDLIRPLAFIDNDFFYGYVHKDDILTDICNDTIVPAYKMEVMNVDREVIKTYEQPGYYIKDVAVAGMRLNIYRVAKSSSGYVSSSMDQLLNKDENESANYATIGNISTDNSKKLLYLGIAGKIDGETYLQAANSILFVKDSDINFKKQIDENAMYYANGLGKYRGGFTSLGEAINVANSYYGYVVSRDGKVLWERFKETSAKVSASNYSGTAQAEMLDRAKSGLKLKGAELEAVLYYISNQIPVIGKIDEDEFSVIVGYDSTKIYLYDFDGYETTLSYDEADSLFGEWDYTFLTCK